ncbi:MULTISPECIES: DUF2625 domain-containing protein [unclassified Moraxella]|uniref:DUF2625 domain-containing protein n=1 Tax=unclassified Moraxella TaxID=2685852 RepID=UPI003AF76498
MMTLEDLVNHNDPAWHLVQEWQQQATNSIETLPKNPQQAEQTLLAMQVTTRSTLGAIIYETGGILINHGWLRILGSGSERLNRSLDTWNQQTQSDGFLLIADDVVGGYFAINGGALEGNLGDVFYFAPDTLAWESLNIGYSDFIYWVFCGAIDQFYANFYWKNWQQDIANLTTDEVFSFMPFLWTAESKSIENVSKKVVPILEDFKFKQSLITL